MRPDRQPLHPAQPAAATAAAATAVATAAAAAVAAAAAAAATAARARATAVALAGAATAVAACLHSGRHRREGVRLLVWPQRGLRQHLRIRLPLLPEL